MTDSHIAAFIALFERIYKGDKHTMSVALAIIKMLHTWDDLIDKDKPVTDAQVNMAFLDALTTIGGSPLWDSEMAGHMRNVYLRWHSANCIEAEKLSDNHLAKAWMLRAGCYDLFVMLAVKQYGVQWGETVAPLVYDFYGETLKEFLEEMQNA